jgi:hypothetical protein
MSLQAVEIVMNRLLTNQELRVRFAIDRLEALGELYTDGLDLTPGELDLFIQSDVQMWSWIDSRIAVRMH